MSLSVGTQFGTFEITGELGVGGMGEVFRATDTRLKRQVAIKVLPASFAADAERLERFQREAEILASLNHPNIAQIYGLEQQDETTALIMELVEGPTLADRITEGPLQPEEALGIARQIIEALEAAHEQHIVHRDLKPANIKLREDGTVKVLDFGIAKPLEARAISGASVPPPLHTPAMTETGLIMGTAAYMSPEQARGRRVDQRTDVWAFGCVLFEMLTGQAAFEGEDVTVTLARVIERETNVDSIPGAISPAVKQVLKLCLVKNPKNRIADIRDVRLALAGEFESAGVGIDSAATASGGWRTAAFLSLASALVAGVAVWLLLDTDVQVEADGPPQIVRYTLPLNDSSDQEEDDEEQKELFAGGADANWGWPALPAFAFSNDGTRLAIAVWWDDGNQRRGDIMLQRLDQTRPVSIPDTEMAFNPFFSPDDQWLGFFHQGAMKRLSLANGTIETLVSDRENFRAGIWGAHWLDDGTIVYGGYDGLFRIRENGTELEQLLALDRTESEFMAFVMPHLLPGGQTLLFHTVKNGYRPADAEIRALDLASGTHSVVLSDAQNPWYLQSTGHLMFVRRGTLMAVPFDPDTLAPEGEPIVVLESVVQAQGMPNLGAESGVAQIAWSSAGHFAYISGGTYPKPNEWLMRVSQDGTAERFIDDEHMYLSLRLSPDRNRILFDEFYGSEGNVYVHELDRDITRRLETGEPRSRYPFWSPDGQSVIYSATSEDNVSAMFRMSASGSGTPERLLPADGTDRTAGSVAPDGSLAFLQTERGTAPDIWILPPEGDPHAFFTSEAQELWPSFSPDGNWIAYVSNESGSQQVYVRPYPAAEPAVQITGNGGRAPAWLPDGTGIVFDQVTTWDDGSPRQILAYASFAPGNPPTIGRVEPYIEHWPFTGSTPIRSWDILDDGSVVTRAHPSEVEALETGTQRVPIAVTNGLDEIEIVLNFVEEMRQRSGRE